MDPKSYGNRYKKALLQKIQGLTETEHMELFKILQRHHVPYTRNTNGVFFNLTSIPDDLIHEIDHFISFCMDNTRRLDEYDKRINDCKISKNYNEFGDVNSESQDSQTLTLFMETKLQIKQNSEWNSLIQISERSEKIATFIESMFSGNSTTKKKCNIKFNVAKKKYSKKIGGDKKIDYESESSLIKDVYILI